MALKMEHMLKSKTKAEKTDVVPGGPVLPNSPVHRLLRLLAGLVAGSLAASPESEDGSDCADSVNQPFGSQLRPTESDEGS